VQGAAVSTGKRFHYRGEGPTDRVNRLRKEVELLELEIHGHTEMKIRLREIHEMVMLTTEQAAAVTKEMAWRLATIRTLGAARHRKIDAIRHWKLRQADARRRYAAAFNLGETT
jgi:hypothetical protein